MKVTRLDWIALSRHSSQMIAEYSFMSNSDPYHAMIVTSEAPLRFVEVPAMSFPQR